MSKKIYLLDDDPLVCLIVEKMISRVANSLTFVNCENGKIGLNRLSEYPGDFSDCIVLLDLNIPVLDGWGFLAGIQSNILKDYQFLSLYILSSSNRQKRY